MNSPDRDEQRSAKEKTEWAMAIAVGVVLLLLIGGAIFLSSMKPLWGF